MKNVSSKVNLMLVSDRADRAGLLQDICQQVGVCIDLRRIPPGSKAVDFVRKISPTGQYSIPDAYFYDFTHPDKNSIAVLREIAFGKRRANAPVVVITSPESQAMLESGDLDGGTAIMFSPTGIISFLSKMRHDNRDRFLQALQTLYQFGPILVRAPRAVLNQDSRELAASA